MNLFSKIVNWYFNKNALPFWCIFILDGLFLLLSGIISHAVFNYGQLFDQQFGMLMNTIVLFVVLSFIGTKVFYTYAGILRYSSFVDLQRVGYANGLSLAIVITVHYWMSNFPETFFLNIPVREIVTMFLLATMLQWAMRIIVKNVFDAVTRSKRAIRVLIYGALSGQFDDLATVKKMKQIVPEYRSNNSIYEELDR